MKMAKLAIIAIVIAAVLLQLAGVATPSEPQGTNIRISAAGPVKVETGEFISNNFVDGTGNISVYATDFGGRVTPLQPHDRLVIDAAVQAGGHSYVVTV